MDIDITSLVGSNLRPDVELQMTSVLLKKCEPLFAAYMADRISTDPAHDMNHVIRVVHLARQLAQDEHADINIIVPAAWLHDCITLPKDAPDKHTTSTLAADEAVRFLRTVAYPESYLESIHHAIIAHSYSADVPPESLEACIVQDADRLDALGAIGIARCMLVGGSLHSPLYNPGDVFCENREPEDNRYVIDHFFCKLLHLAEKLHTPSARKEADRRLEFMRLYLEEFRRELSVNELYDNQMQLL